MKIENSSDGVLRPFASRSRRALGLLRLAAVVITMIALYLLQDWVFETQVASVKYLFGAWVLAAGAAIYAVIADRSEADIPWWYTFALLLLGSLIHLARAFDAI